MSEEATEPKPKKVSVWRQIIEDARISHGAFRLWHHYRDRANEESKCFVGYDFISRHIGCNEKSIKRWNDELVTHGWLTVKTQGKACGFRNEYTVLDGAGQRIKSTPKNGRYDYTQKRGSFPRTRKRKCSTTKNGGSALPKTEAEVTSTKDRGEQTPESSCSPPHFSKGDLATQSPYCSGEKAGQKNNAGGGGSEKTPEEIKAEKSQW